MDPVCVTERMETLKVHGLCDVLTGFIWVKHPSPPQLGLKQRKERPQEHFKAHIQSQSVPAAHQCCPGHPGRT